MNLQAILARALACLLAAGACAQAAQPTRADPADPRAAVPATTYHPVLAPRGDAPPAASPARDWEASNATVAAYNPMMLTMKPRPGQGDPHAGHHMPAAAPAAPAAEAHAGQAAPAAPAHHHAQHGAQQ